MRLPLCALFASLGILSPVTSRASAVYEVFRATPQEMKTAVLDASIGQVFIGVSSSASLITFTRAKAGWQTLGTFRLDDAKPVSAYGYDGVPDPSLKFGYSSFPLMKRDGEYVEVAIDITSGKKIWLREGDGVRVLQHARPQCPPCTVSLFHLTNPKSLALFPRPDASSKAVVVPRPAATAWDLHGFDYARFRVLETRGDWLHVVRLEYVDPAAAGIAPAGIVESAKDTGWTRMRDANGHLTVWFVNDSDMEYR